MHMGDNERADIGPMNKCPHKGTYLWWEGAQHAATVIGAAALGESDGVARSLLAGLDISERPPAFAAGVRAACETALANPNHSVKKRK